MGKSDGFENFQKKGKKLGEEEREDRMEIYRPPFAPFFFSPPSFIALPTSIFSK